MLTLLLAVVLHVQPPSGVPSHASFEAASSWVQNHDEPEDDDDIRPSDEEGNDGHSETDNDELA